MVTQIRIKACPSCLHFVGTSGLVLSGMRFGLSALPPQAICSI